VSLEELGRRIKNLEAGTSTASSRKPDPDEKQKRLLLNLDILTRAEQRSESLRKQVFDMMEKESNIRTRLDSLEYDLRPEMIERNASMVGTLRPEEIRDSRKKSLQSEKTNLQNLLTQIQTTRASLEISLARAEELVEKLRLKFEKEIDTALEDNPDNNN
jgi:predicted  nucleic acid-binding Zn-ribbon protein